MMFSVALIGAGRVGGIRAGVIHNSRDALLKVVADVDTNRAAEVGRSAGAAAVPDWRLAVMDPGIDLVVISTPTKFHAEIAVAALQAGKHVLCEKPLGRTVDEAEQIVQAAKRARRVLKTGFNYRHMAHVRKAKELIAADKLGRLYFLRCRYGHGGRPGYEKVWCTNADLSGGGVLLEQGIHTLDLVRYLLGEPSRVLCHVERFFWNFPTVEDNCFCLLQTLAGQIAQLHFSWTQWVNVFEIEIFGRDGYLRLDGRDGHYGPQRLVLGKRNPQHSRPQEQISDFGNSDDSWQLEWGEFLSAIRARRTPEANGLDGLRAQQLVEAAYQSAARQAWVDVPSFATSAVRER